jgi:hypothetical protein
MTTNNGQFRKVQCHLIEVDRTPYLAWHQGPWVTNLCAKRDAKFRELCKRDRSACQWGALPKAREERESP